jgi:hypothetical protein
MTEELTDAELRYANIVIFRNVPRIRYEPSAVTMRRFWSKGDTSPLKCDDSRSWLDVNSHDFQRTADGRIIASITGLRSDGQYFVVSIPLTIQSFRESGGIERQAQLAVDKFESYRTCSCGIIDYEETGEVDEEGDPVTRAVFSPCERHPRQ